MLENQISWAAAAPGRINLIGEHTDYNDGFTLPMAIEGTTRITAVPTDDAGFMTFRSQAYPETVKFSVDGERCLSHDEPPSWAKYVRGVLIEFSKLGLVFPALHFQIQSTVPVGAGVSSSAALSVSLAMTLQQISGSQLSGLQIAQLCQRVEHLHIGVPCGLMDQLASVFGTAGNLMLLDCRTNRIEQIPLSDEVTVLVIDSRVKHNLATGEYRVRREQCDEACRIMNLPSLREATMDQLKTHQNRIPEVIFRRAKHVVTENTRTGETANCLKRQDWQAAGERMYASHESMRSDFEITTPELDQLVAIAKNLGVDRGVFGARMTGGGFGGCTIQLVDAKNAEAIRDSIIQTYEMKSGTTVDGFVTRPADGALAMAEKRRSRKDN